MSSSKEHFEVAGIRAARGTKATGSLTVLELADASSVDYPIVVIAGKQAGPTLYVGAAIHGDEVNGIEIVHEAMRAIDPTKLTGDVICVPMQNPLALRMQHRLPLQLLNKSPMDQFPADPWMCFPGDRDGNSPQIMAAALFGLMKDANAIVDIHTPTTGGKYVPFIFLPPPTVGDTWERSMELARAFGPDFILAAKEGVYVMDGSLHVTMAEGGIPAFGVELGEGGRVDQNLSERGAKGVLNVMRAMGMLEGPIEELATTRVIESMTALRTSRGGLLHVHAEHGTDLAEGDLIATVTNRYGDVVETIEAPHGGPFMRITTFATVAAGERVAQIGIEV